MSESVKLVVFRLDAQRYALPLAAVERIVRAVEVTPFPKAISIVHGVISVGGVFLPVLNIRRRFHLPEREIGPDDHFLIAQTTQRKVVLVVDAALSVIERPRTEIIDSAKIVPGVEQIHGVVMLQDDLVLIHDLERFLSLDEARALDAAMSREALHGG